jgi:1,4-alpha-glucan branching enzyme
VGEGGVGFDYRLQMAIADMWIDVMKMHDDFAWGMGHIIHTLTNRRYAEACVGYAESHDQALVGDKTLAFWLMDQEMYWHMAKDDPHPVIERGIALHKLIRLATLAFGGEGWLNFMGNEFGHPEWLDFPREGNGWSFHYCRRQWSLVENPDLKYHWLSDFDRALMELASATRLLESAPARCLHIDHGAKILVAERANLIFVLNFSVDQSPFGYPLRVDGTETRSLLLDTDHAIYGGHGRVDHSFQYPVENDGVMKIYAPSRTGLVFGKASPLNGA